MSTSARGDPSSRDGAGPGSSGDGAASRADKAQQRDKPLGANTYEPLADDEPEEGALLVRRAAYRAAAPCRRGTPLPSPELPGPAPSRDEGSPLAGLLFFFPEDWVPPEGEPFCLGLDCGRGLRAVSE